MSSAKSDAKTVKTLAIVFGIFVMCWVPFFLVSAVITTQDRVDIDAIHNAAFIFGLLNSAMNPLIYGWRNKDFRRAYLITLRLRKRQNEWVP